MMNALRIALAALGLLSLFSLSPARAAQNRFYLASQQDFGRDLGFYLDFENSSEGDAPCPLRTLKLIWGVGDGHGWRFLTTPTGFAWQRDKVYTVKATAGPDGARVWLNGRRLADSPGGWRPDTGPLLAGSIPSWAHGPAEYQIQQTSVSLNGSKPISVDFGPGPFAAPGLRLFEAQDPRRWADWTAPANLTVTAAFRLVPTPDPRALAPVVDAYGQARAARWPGKAQSDADLHAAARDEQRRLARWPAPVGHDRYGGLLHAGWTTPATGYYGVVKHNGFWWLTSPAGHPVFYTSVCTAPATTWDKTPVTGRESLFQSLPPRTGATAVAWGRNAWGENTGAEYVAFQAANMARKYGPDWQSREKSLAARRLRAWGFSGTGKWSDSLAGVPHVAVLNRGSIPTVAAHPDIFDPSVQHALADSLRTQMAAGRTDPLLVGWSLGNEHDEIITAAEIRDILKKSADVPAKRALLEYAVNTLYHGDATGAARAGGVTAQTRDQLFATTPAFSDTDVEQMRRFYADRYYGFLYQTVKTIDPHHLYFGFWIVPGWWENEEDWRLIARHCDVIGYDRYAFDFADASLTRLIREASKPVFCGEMSFPPAYHGARGFGVYESSWAPDEAQAGASYARYLGDAARDPYCVGVSWFQYRDEPVTGRGPGIGPAPVYGEDFAFGLVDVTDHPKWDLLTPMRAANLRAPAQRLAASAQRRVAPR